MNVEVTRLVVSELVTGARKYAVGPILLGLRIAGALVEVQVWDSESSAAGGSGLRRGPGGAARPGDRHGRPPRRLPRAPGAEVHARSSEKSCHDCSRHSAVAGLTLLAYPEVEVGTADTNCCAGSQKDTAPMGL
jgi:hypothetical protein